MVGSAMNGVTKMIEFTLCPRGIRRVLVKNAPGTFFKLNP